MEEADLFSTAKSKLELISARFNGKKPNSKPTSYNFPREPSYSPTTEIKEFQIKVSPPEKIDQIEEIPPFEEENTQISVNKEDVDKIISRYSSLREPEPSYPVWRSQKVFQKPQNPEISQSSILRKGTSYKENAKVKIKDPPLSNFKPLVPTKIVSEQRNPESSYLNDYFSVPQQSKSHNRSHSQIINLNQTQYETNSQKKKFSPPKSLFSTPTKTHTKKKIFEKINLTPTKVNDLSKSMEHHKVKKLPISRKVNAMIETKLDLMVVKRGGKLLENNEVSIFFKFQSTGNFRIFIQNKLQWRLSEIYLKVPYFKGLEQIFISPNESTFDLPEFSSKVFDVQVGNYNGESDSLVMILEYRKDNFSTDFQELNFALKFSVFHFLEFEPVIFDWFRSYWKVNRGKVIDGNFSVSSREAFFRLIDFIGFVIIEKISEYKERYFTLGRIQSQNCTYLIKLVLQDHWLTVKALTPDGSLSSLKSIINEIKFLV